MTLKYIQPGAWNSRAVIHGDTAWLSGIVADDKTAPMKDQTAQILAKIDSVLAEIGSDKTKILSSVVYLADMNQKDAMNEAWMAWMDKGHPPARAAVGVTLTPGTLVEIMVQAAI
jgi:enamine deaminase RidA (YjgF/YER057c/UK114 family)